MTDDELNVMQRIRKAAGVGCKPMLYDMPGIVAELKINSDRYKKIRLMTPQQFSEIQKRNICTGISFDQLIDDFLFMTGN